MTKYQINDNLLRRIVHSVNKAVNDDIPRYLREHHKETNNAVIHLRGDYINDNLRKYVMLDGIELIPFKRSSWQGRILVDRNNKITYSITTQNTLNRIPKKKDRTRPHFLQSILAVENRECKCQYVQQTLFPIESFDDKTLESDYNEIFATLVNPNEGYIHYVISYEAKNNELLDIKLEVLDRNFYVAFEKSLNEYIEPDFANLTETNIEINETSNSSSDDVRNILGIKNGIRPALREIEKEG